MPPQNYLAPDFTALPLAAAPPARFAVVATDGVLPDGFFSTSNLPTYVRLETVVLSQLSSLFPGQVVRDACAFRILRDAELDIDDEGGGDDFL